MYKKVESTQPPRFSGGSSRENREKWYYQAKPCASCGPAIPIKVTTYMAKPLIFQYANEKGWHLTGFIENYPTHLRISNALLFHRFVLFDSPKMGKSWKMTQQKYGWISPAFCLTSWLAWWQQSFFRENPKMGGIFFKWSENLGLKTWPPFFGAKVQVTWKLARHLDKHDSGDQARSN